MPGGGPLCFTAGAAVLAVGRDWLAARQPSIAGPVVTAGYALLLLVTVVSARLAGLDWTDLGIGRRCLGRRLGGGLAMGGVLALPAALRSLSAPLALVAALPGATAVATIEELLFRGVAFALLSRSFTAAWAVAISSLAFAAAHAALYPLPILLVGAVVGLMLGLWRWLAADLLGCILAHTIADAVDAALVGG